MPDVVDALAEIRAGDLDLRQFVSRRLFYCEAREHLRRATPEELSAMNHRRKFMRDIGISLLAVTPPAAHAATASNYDEATRATWRHTGAPPTGEAALLRELVRYATLAPSSHNTQCWKFKLAPRLVSAQK